MYEPQQDGDRQAVATTTVVELVDPDVVRLANGTATIRRILAERWPLAAGALFRGATPDQVAAAAGLDLSELRVAMTRWGTAACRDGRLTEQQRVELANTVFGRAS